MGQFSFKESQQRDLHVSFVNADGTAFKTVSGTQIPDLYIDKILLSNNDTIAHVVDFAYLLSGTSYVIGSVTVPAGQGFAGTPALDAIVSLFPSGDQGLPVANNALQAAVEVVVTAGKFVYLSTTGGYI